jgi:alcohol dehydrogenase class IV
MQKFTFSRMPQIIFGQGTFYNLASVVSRFGNNVLIITGGHSFYSSGRMHLLEEQFTEKGLHFSVVQTFHEPSPDDIDTIVNTYRDSNISVVCAIGGGSVIDTGKAVSAMLTQNAPVSDYLEGVGTKEHSGKKVPLVALPTTSGTGSEATKNAVLSRVGSDGYKKSLRHDNFIPDIALVDPELTLPCSAKITAQCGMDAFTQLLESYVSTKSNPMTDALALSGLGYIKDCLVFASTTGGQNIEYRTGMAYASLISGITLSQAGLGTVHGIAGTIGGFFNAPHGGICGSLLPAVTKATIEKLIPDNATSESLVKYARVGALFSDTHFSEDAIVPLARQLAAIIESWADILKMPYLSEYGITEQNLPHIAHCSDNKNNPAVFSEEEMIAIMRKRLYEI